MATSDLKTSKTLKRTWTTPQNVKRPYFTFRQKGQHPSPLPFLYEDLKQVREGKNPGKEVG